MQQKFSNADIEIKKTETVFLGFFRVLRYRLRHRLFNGSWSSTMQRELFARGDSVGILLYDPRRDLIALARQFRIGCLQDDDAWPWEVVAGMVKPGERACEVAVREVAEETGLELNNDQLLPITRYYSSPGGSDERLQLYCGLCDLPDSIEGTYGLPEEHEDIRISLFATPTLFSAMLDGTINNAATIIALQWLQLNRDALQSKMAFQGS